MRHWLIFILALGLTGRLYAQNSAIAAHQEGISAATDSAVQGLIDQIEPVLIVPHLTVKDFLDRTGSEEDFRAALSKSDPVGGPRWLDDKTCQVRLEVSGTEVVVDLANIAVKQSTRSPIAAADLARLAGGLSAHWFAATGTSTAAGIAPPPPADSPWVAIPADQRRRAVAAADADAAEVILKSLDGVQLTPGHPLGQALREPSVRQSLTDWIATRPVTAVDYRGKDHNELEVRVTLAVNPSDLFDVLRATLTARNDFPRPPDAAAWALVREDVLHRMAAPIGRATPTVAATLPLVLPEHPPDWADTMADAVGKSEPAASALLTARAAERDAMDHLTQQVLDLPLTADQTLGQAVRQDHRLARALKRAMASARLYKSEYNADGSVVARVSLDLRLLWSAIRER